MAAPQIVLCGSMKFFPWIIRTQQVLLGKGISAVAPTPDEDALFTNPRTAITAKRKAAFVHMQRIRSTATIAILVANFDRNGDKDYIGPNTLGEIAIAVAHRKAIYVLNSVPAGYADELTAWGVKALRGDLGPLIEKYFEYADASTQLHLFAS